MGTTAADGKVTMPPSQMELISNMITALGGTKTTNSPADTSLIPVAYNTVGSAVPGLNATQAGLDTNISDLAKILLGLQGQDSSAMLASIFQKAGQQIPGLEASLSNALGARSGARSGATSAALQKLLADTTVTAQDQLVKQQLANFVQQAATVQQQTNANQAKTQNSQAIINAGGTQGNIAAQLANATKGQTTTVAPDAGNAAKNLAILQALKALGVGDFIKQAAGITTNPEVDSNKNVGPQGETLQATQQPAFIDTLKTLFTSTPDNANVETVGETNNVYIPEVGSTDYSPIDMTGFFTPTPTPTVDVVNTAPDLGSGMYNFDNYDDTYTYANGGRVHKCADGGAVNSRRSVNPLQSLLAPATSSSIRGGGDGQSTYEGMSGIKQVSAPRVSLPNVMQIADLAKRRTSLGQDNTSILGAGTGVQKVGYGLAAANLLAKEFGGISSTDLPGNFSVGDVNLAASLLAAKNTDDLAKIAVTSQVPYAGNVINLHNAFSGDDGNAKTNAVLSAVPVYGQVYGAANALSQLVGGPNFGQEINNGITGVTEIAGDVLKGAGDVVGGVLGGVTGGIADLFGWKDGGAIDGPGTGTSDSIPAKLSDGEYIISADVVDKIGQEFFDQLQAAFHTPVQRRA